MDTFGINPEKLVHQIAAARWFVFQLMREVEEIGTLMQIDGSERYCCRNRSESLSRNQTVVVRKLAPWWARICVPWLFFTRFLVSSKSGTSQGIKSAPFWLNPNSCSAALSRPSKSGWFKYGTGITNRWCSWPTYTATNPLGTGLDVEGNLDLEMSRFFQWFMLAEGGCIFRGLSIRENWKTRLIDKPRESVCCLSCDWWFFPQPPGIIQRDNNARNFRRRTENQHRSRAPTLHRHFLEDCCWWIRWFTTEFPIDKLLHFRRIIPRNENFFSFRFAPTTRGSFMLQISSSQLSIAASKRKKWRIQTVNYWILRPQKVGKGNRWKTPAPCPNNTK